MKLESKKFMKKFMRKLTQNSAEAKK